MPAGNHVLTAIKEKVMPTYEYQCSTCDYAFEVLQSMLEKKLRKCPECSKNTLHRLIGTGSGIIFKGTGFYETDFKTKKEPKKELKSADSAEKSDSQKKASKNNTSQSDTSVNDKD